MTKKFDWPSVDWTKSNKEIASVLGVNEATVRIKRSDPVVGQIRQNVMLSPQSTSKIWTAQNDQYLIDHYNEVGPSVLADYFGTTRQAVSNRASILGVERQKRKPWNEEDVKYLKKNYARQSSEELAAYFGITVHAVCAKANKLGLKKLELVLLTPEQFEIMADTFNLHGARREAMRLVFVDGATRKAAAEAVGMAANRVSTIASYCTRWVLDCLPLEGDATR